MSANDGVIQIGIEGFLNEGNAIVRVYEHDCGRPGAVGWAHNKDGGQDALPFNTNAGIRKVFIASNGMVREYKK